MSTMVIDIYNKSNERLIRNVEIDLQAKDSISAKENEEVDWSRERVKELLI